MKIQLDTKNKTIKLESDEKLQDIVDTLERLLPKGEWKKFTLETNVVINHWSNPIVIREYPRRDWDWHRSPWICTTSGSTELGNNNLKANYSLNDGVFNIEA